MASLTGDEMLPNYTPTSDEKTLALLSHVLTFVAPILAPLIIYLIKKDESQFVAWHAKESLNFHITLTLVCILLFITLIGILLLWFVGVIALVLILLPPSKPAKANCINTLSLSGLLSK